MKIYNSQRGFTLVELAIYMGISMMILLLLTSLLSAILSTRLTTQSTIGIAQDGRYIYVRLIYDINHADSITTPANLGNTSNTLVLTTNGTQYTYRIQDGNLILVDPQGLHSMNGPDTTISGLTFQRIGNVNGKHTIRINYVITSKVLSKGTLDSQAFQTTAGLR